MFVTTGFGVDARGKGAACELNRVVSLPSTMAQNAGTGIKIKRG